MAKDKKQETEKKVKKHGFRLIPFLGLLIALPFMMPTLLVCAGLLPTLVALFTDDDPDKSRAVCIGAMNFAGVSPFLIDLWMKGQEMRVAWSIVRDPQSWLIMFGAAGIGYLILFAIPPMMMSLTVAQAENRLTRLRESAEALKKIWGPDVASNRGLEEIRKQNGG